MGVPVKPPASSFRLQRREFLLLAAGTTIPWNPAFAAAAIPCIGVIGPGSGAANRASLDVLRDGLRALGWVDGEQKRQLLQAASVFALPSSQENFGISTAEAMASFER